MPTVSLYTGKINLQIRLYSCKINIKSDAGSGVQNGTGTGG